MQEEVPETPEEAQPLNGVFLDSPVSGLGYAAATFSGTTDENGNFDYAEGETVTFSIGGLDIGSSIGQAEVSPIDISGISNPTINTVEVRNIATFLQSLDSDGDPSNGITITDETASALEDPMLEFDVDSFLEDLKELITSINSENSTTLELVTPNAAALHLAESLGKEADFEILPRVMTGRQWEMGIYFPYNSAAASEENPEYVFDIGSDLTGLRYHFGSNTGFLMDMTYGQGKLTGTGNLYNDLDQDPPTVTSWEYRNRITSPGVVFDYAGDTYLGYINYFKTDGEIGILQGTYESFFTYDEKRIGQDPFLRFVSKIILTIGDSDTDGNFTVTRNTYDEAGTITGTETTTINQSELDEERLLLIQFQGTDYIFLNYVNQIAEYFSPGLFTIK